MDVDDVTFAVDETKRGGKRGSDASGDDAGAGIDLDELEGELDEETIRKLVDEAPEVDALDSSGLKKLLSAFEKAYTKNQRLRVKFPDDPPKFMESELDLDLEIKKLQTVAAAPSLYPEMMRLSAHLSLLALISHENPDISVDAIEVFKELTDSDVFEENPENVTALVDSLLENQFLEALVGNLSRLKEEVPEEKAGVYNSLAVIENMSETRMDQVCAILEKTSFLKYVLKRFRVREFDDVKGYCSELLSVLVQNSKAFQLDVPRNNGLDTLLSVVAAYKKVNPPTPEEEEMIENVFNVLCVVCPREENRATFMAAEGLQLVQILIKNKKYCRKCALKLLDFVLAGNPDFCKKWADIGGLGSLFGAFMKKGASKHKKGYDERSDDEHIISSISSLFEAFENDANYRLRLLAKFSETEFEKVERLVDLHVSYLARAAEIEKQIDKEKEDLATEGIEITDVEEDEFYMRRLDAGLYTLQLVDLVIALVCSADTSLKQKTDTQMRQQDASFDDVKKVLRLYAKSLGNGNDDELREAVKRKRDRVSALADSL